MNIALVARVKTSRGKFLFRTIEFAKNNRPDIAKVERVGAITAYYLRYSDGAEANGKQLARNDCRQSW